MAFIKVTYQGQTLQNLELDPQREYLAGRSESCALHLPEGQGISRSHFKIFYQEGIWKIDVVAKFGSVYFNGRPEKSLELSDQVIFRIPPYEFQFLEKTEETQLPPQSSNLPVATSEPAMDLAPPAEGIFIEDPSEGTRVGDPLGVPFIKIMGSNGTAKQVLRLDGRSWIAGRESICAIHIEDPRVSRRQFEITQTNDGFFIIDLGSANGTQVNGELISSTTYTPLRSGDAISVLDNFLYFELRDPQFEKKLLAVNSNPLPFPFQSAEEPPSEHISSDPHENFEGGSHDPVSIYPQNHDSFEYQQPRRRYRKKNEMNPVRMIIVILLLGAGGYWFFDKEKPPKSPVVGNIPFDPFGKLTPEQKSLVKHSYNLAKNLYIQGKYELAAQEIAKVHELIPEYEDSKEIEQQCQNAFEINRQRALIERQEAETKEQEEKVQRVVSECRKKLNANSNPSVIEQCLQPALEINPEHEKIIALKAEAERLADEQRARTLEKEAYQGSIQKAKSLFTKAESLDRSGDLLKAKKAYEVFLSSGLPDPQGLKSVARRKIASIQNSMTKQLSDVLSESQKLASSKDFKGAIQNLDKAIRNNPENENLKTQQETYKKDLSKMMRDIYQESILDESLGNVESAKEKWKKIIDTSIASEEYYRKAAIKLKKYGGN